MTVDDAIINPAKGKNDPNLGPVAVLVATRPDLYTLCDGFNFSKDDHRRLFISRLYFYRDRPNEPAVVGPMIGAPYAAVLLETLVAWGARRFIFFGWCGAISQHLKIGDIILATSALIDEGTSKHYDGDESMRSFADDSMTDKVRRTLEQRKVDYHEGLVWSTDAPFRETREKVEYYQSREVLAVEMESSALFTVGKFREVAVAAILVVSDELSAFKWKPGFKNERFQQGRMAACRIITDLCKLL